MTSEMPPARHVTSTVPPFVIGMVGQLLALAATPIVIYFDPSEMRDLRLHPWPYVASLGIFGLFASSVLFGLVQRTEVDDRGVIQSTWMRRTVRLRWSEVEGVQWSLGRAVLWGQGRRIGIALETTPLREHLRTALATVFVLVDPPPPKKSFIRIAAVALVFCVPMLIAYRKAVTDPDHMRAWAVAIFAPMALPFLAVPLVIWRERNRVGIIHWRAGCKPDRV